MATVPSRNCSKGDCPLRNAKGNCCLFCTHDPHLVCSVYPDGVEGNSCINFEPEPELEGKQFIDFLGIGETYENPYSDAQEQWEPLGASYYNGN